MPKMHRSPLGFMLAAIALVLLFPVEAHANVISIFNQMLLMHLFVGNAVIGLIDLSSE